jgi:uridine kinase
MQLTKLIETIIFQYENRIFSNCPFIIGIDGPGGSGKTTLACRLEDELESYGFELLTLHIDDYIVKTEERYQTGHEQWAEYYHLQWNIPLIQSALFKSLHNYTATISLPVYDHHSNTIVDKTTSVPAGGIVLVEGVFLQRKEWRGYFDYMIYMDCPMEIRSERVMWRDRYMGGYEARLNKYQQRYWPAEDFYLEQEDPAGKADYVYYVGKSCLN